MIDKVPPSLSSSVAFSLHFPLYFPLSFCHLFLTLFYFDNCFVSACLILFCLSAQSLSTMAPAEPVNFNDIIQAGKPIDPSPRPPLIQFRSPEEEARETRQ